MTLEHVGMDRADSSEPMGFGGQLRQSLAGLADEVEPGHVRAS